MNLTSISPSLRTVQKRASEGCFCAFHWRTQGKDKVILSVNLFILSFYLISLSLHVSSSALSGFWCILFTGKKYTTPYVFAKTHKTEKRQLWSYLEMRATDWERVWQTWRPFNDWRGLAGMRRHCVKLLAFQSAPGHGRQQCSDLLCKLIVLF